MEFLSNPFFIVLVAAVAFAVGYLVKRNNPYIKGVDDFIDKVDEGAEEDIQKAIKKLQKKLKELEENV